MVDLAPVIPSKRTQEAVSKAVEKATLQAAEVVKDRRAQVAAGAVAATGVAAAAVARRRRSPDRAYALRRGEKAADGIRRIADGRAQSAVDELRGRGEPERPAAVHEARKDLKKLRSVIRLVRGPLGEEVYRHENDRFRDAGRMLSGMRDADVRVETLEALRERFPGELDDRDLDVVVREDGARPASQHGGNGPDALARAAREIEAGGNATSEWQLDGEDWDLIEDGLRRAYRRSRNRFRETAADPTDESVHEWRKRVKDLWYDLRILAPAEPERIGRMAKGVHKLSDLLGDHHDLTVLRDHVSSNGALAGTSSLLILRRAIGRRQDELLARALHRGEKLYTHKPKAFTKRLRSHWRDWRQG
jgi:CHAD domain-containing protein